jgi:putative oxidoreductase
MTTTTVSARGARGRELLAALLGTRTASWAADIGLVLARTVLAWVFIYHGARRLFGWFGGAGFHAGAEYFAHTAGLRPGTLFVLLSGLIEFGGGIALAFGLLSRLVGMGLFTDMMMAIITVTWSNGINATGTKSGYELNLALGLLALMIAVFGAGRISVDHVLSRRLFGTESDPSG